MKFSRNIPHWFLFTLLFVTGCAQMSEPNGGLKDSTAPQVIDEKTFPANGNVNFKGNEIEISFDEYMQVKTQQVVITPGLQQKPVIKTKGKKMIIRFDEPLKENTTYTLNLSGAVADITEGNVAENLQYVFSTGPYLDSLSISGKVINAYTLNGVSSTTVILHATENDSSIRKEKPSYFLKTAKDGSFTFHHLKPGAYRIYALQDQNADLLYNGSAEEIACLDSVVYLHESVSGIILQQFKPVEQKTYLRSGTSVSKYVQTYRFNKLLETPRIEIVKPSTVVRTFVKNPAMDSVLSVSIADTLLTDTVYFAVYSADTIVDTLSFTAHLSRKTTGKTIFTPQYNPDLYVTDSVFISTNMPCDFNPDMLSITDTLHHKKVLFTSKTWFNGTSIFPSEQEEKSPLQFVFKNRALTSQVTGQANDSIAFIVTAIPVQKMGILELTLDGFTGKKMGHPVAVLLYENNPAGKLAMAPGQTMLRFEKLKPGNYTIYIFDDADGNSAWSTGNFDTHQQPERIFRLKQPIKIKANWEQQVTWAL